VEDFLNAGFNIGTWPIRSLYRQLFRSHLKRGNNLEALKVWLKLYYEVDPVSVPRPIPDDRVNSLKKLVSLIRTLQLEESTLVPVEVRTVLPLIHRNLSAKVWRDTEACFGPDSRIAVFEKMQHQKQFGNPNSGISGNTVTGNGLDKVTLVEGMNRLLAWAGLPVASEQKLFHLL
jgi:hypothetical protein